MSGRAPLRFVAALCASLVLLWPRAPAAHDFRPGVLALAEVAPGRFDVLWTAPVDSTGEPEAVRLVWPPGCLERDRRLECGASGLRGSLRFESLHQPGMQVVVTIRRLDGRVEDRLATGASPAVDLGAAPRRALLPWVRLGVDHILGGADHLAFVIGLLLLVGRDRRVVATITAFTLAHSITLVLAVLGVVALPGAPVEATIAASTVLVAREALVREPTLTRRAPWAVALVFGLVHGLGFAEGLRALGLPEGSYAGALVGFNLGIELGQLLVVGLLLGAAWLARRRLERLAWARPAACYGVGALGAWWLCARTLAMVAGG
jgi:hydrogenase/urease accessory protein HupE